MGKEGAPDGFEWDPVKAARNIEKDGTRFELAAAAFLDERRLDQADNRYDYGEDRRIIIAAIDEQLYTVVYVMRGDVCRIISARPASRKERDLYGHR